MNETATQQRRFGVSAIFAGALLAAAGACGPMPEDPTRDAATPGPDGAMTSPDAPITNPMGGPARVRVAHLSPNAPAVDVCVRARGTSFTAPLLRGMGLAQGLAYGQVTAYVQLEPGDYEVRLVAPNASDCNTPIANLPNYSLPTLRAGATVTAAAIGVLGGSVAGADFTVTAFNDDPTRIDASEYRLSFFHAAPGVPAVDVGVLDRASGAFNVLFDNAAYGPEGAATERAVWGAAVPAPGVTLAARLHGTTPAVTQYPLAIDGITLPGGAGITAYAVGRPGDNDAPLSVLVCNDGMTAGGLTQCDQLPQRARVRVAHLSPDAPAVDFCVKPTGAADDQFSGPVLAGSGRAAGISFPSLTGYIALAPAAYTVRLVAAGSRDCRTSLAGLPGYDLPALTPNAYVTVAAVGRVGGTPSFTLRPYVDTHDAAPAGRANVRFIHASPGTPNVDVGLAGATFTPLWSNVAFAGVGRGTNTDANGFLTSNPLMDATVSVRATGTTADALLLRGINAPAGAVLSVFAIGALSGPEPLSVLLCHDRVAPSMGLAVCARLR